MSHQKVEKLAEAGIIAARILGHIADATGTSYLKVVSGVGLSIFGIVQVVKTNKEKCTIMTERVYQLVCAIINCCSDSENSMSAALLRSISTLTVTLQKVLSFMRNQVGGNFVKRITRHLENAALMDDCMSSLHHALTLFRVQTDIMTAAMIAEMQLTAAKRHRELTAIINAPSDNQSLVSLQSSSSLSILLPASPKIFHGRETQLDHILSQLRDDSAARIAILGPGGIGKSALALAILYHPEIIDKYGPRRYWISCDSCNSLSDFIAVLAAHFSVDQEGDPTNAVLRSLAAMDGRGMLVLDNFETPWEPAESRVKLEGFLSRIADIDQLALIVTMRGAERPAQIKWNRPFMKPLEPLSHIAARETFLDISDVAESDPHIDELLALTDNLPLAVALMASAAESEGCEALLRRNTALLSEGMDKRSNLEKSISISLQSPRISSTPHAQELLSALAFLPDGLTDADLDQISLPFVQVGRCRTALCRTSLAYINEGQRLKLLAPVREFIQKSVPPSVTTKTAVRKYFFGLVELAGDADRTPGIARKLMSNIGNISATIRLALQEKESDVEAAVSSVLKIDALYDNYELGKFDLLRDIADFIEELNDDGIRAHYLLAQSTSQEDVPVEALRNQAVECFERIGDLEGQSKAYQMLATLYLRNGRNTEAIEACRTSFKFATKAQAPNAQAYALFRASATCFNTGKYSASFYFAQLCQERCQAAGNMRIEAMALSRQATALAKLGNFAQASALVLEAQTLLETLGMKGRSVTYYTVMARRGDIHLTKSEYEEARNAFVQEYAFTMKGQLINVIAQLNLLLVDVAITPAPLASIKERLESVSQNIPVQLLGVATEIINFIWGKYFFHLKEYDKARTYCLLSVKPDSECETIVLCLETLADIGLAQSDFTVALRYCVLFLAVAQTTDDRSARLHALRRLGDVFILQQDQDTASALFSLTLEGFTKMDIHRGRAECLLRMGDICKSRDEAKENWQQAQDLFRRCSQGDSIAACQTRIAHCI